MTLTRQSKRLRPEETNNNDVQQLVKEKPVPSNRGRYDDKRKEYVNFTMGTFFKDMVLEKGWIPQNSTALFLEHAENINTIRALRHVEFQDRNMYIPNDKLEQCKSLQIQIPEGHVLHKWCRDAIRTDIPIGSLIYIFLDYTCTWNGNGDSCPKSEIEDIFQRRLIHVGEVCLFAVTVSTRDNRSKMKSTKKGNYAFRLGKKINKICNFYGYEYKVENYFAKKPAVITVWGRLMSYRKWANLLLNKSLPFAIQRLHLPTKEKLKQLEQDRIREFESDNSHNPTTGELNFNDFKKPKTSDILDLIRPIPDTGLHMIGSLMSPSEVLRIIVEHFNRP